MKDLISREWLIEAVEEGWIRLDTQEDYNRIIHLVRDMAPSAQPEWEELLVICDVCGHAIRVKRREERKDGRFDKQTGGD